MRTALPNTLCSGYCEATEEEGDQGTPGGEIWSQKWGQQDSSTTGERWFKTELDGEKWSVAYAPLGTTRHKSGKTSQIYRAIRS